MEVLPVSALAIAVCVLTLIRPIAWGLPLFGATLPLKTAAAVNLTALGDSSVLISQLSIVAFVTGIIARADLRRGAIIFAQKNMPVLLLGAFVSYAAVTAIFMPRIFEGSIRVLSFSRDTIGVSTLKPMTGNITQSAYLMSELFLVWAVAFVVSRPGGLARAGVMINIFTISHLAFAVIDAIPASATFMEFFRTANYAIHTDQQIAGMRRVIGSYSEASAFGASSVLIFAFNFSRFLQTRGTWFFIASLLTLACAIVSLSSTGFVTLGILGGLWGISIIWGVMAKSGLGREQMIVFIISIFLGLLASGMVILDPVREFVIDMYDRLIGGKLSTDSGVERSSWNQMALQNAIDTFGLGVGLGGARASSLATALLSNTGIFGTALFIAFLVTSSLRSFPKAKREWANASYIYKVRVFNASRAAVLAGLGAGIVSGTTVDLGPTFFTFVGVAVGALAAYRNENRVRIKSNTKSANFLVNRELSVEPQFFGATQT
ncbi:MAG: hypothetical protein AAF720_15290 [Pseudomonadota bacterium]